MDQKWRTRFMALAEHVSGWSKDPSTKVGSVIVDEQKRVLGHGYNGFPRGVEDHAWRYEDRELKYKMIVHAEANAILNSVRPVRGMTLVTTKYPCAECAKLIVQSGVRRVVCPVPTDRWRADADVATVILQEAGVEIWLEDAPSS